MTIQCFFGVPAHQVVLNLERAPLFLRVVFDSKTGKWDALDQPDDEIADTEEIYVYKMDGQIQNGIMCGRKSGCQRFEYAYYELYHKPTHDQLRDYEFWKTWTHEQAEREVK